MMFTLKEPSLPLCARLDSLMFPQNKPTRDLEFISQPISDECFLPFEVHLQVDVSDLYLQKRNFARLLIACLSIFGFKFSAFKA